MTTRFSLAAAFAILAAPALADAPTATVLDTLILPETPVGEQALAELSGLAHDPQSGVLYGVSDQGILFTFDLTTEGDRLSLTPTGAARLTDADGETLKSKKFDPEGLALMPAEGGDTRLMILSETGPQAGIFDAQGQMVAEHPLPDALAPTLDERRGKHGPESLALLSAGELVTAPEVAAENPDGSFRHNLLTSEGRDLSYSQPNETRLKAMATLRDGRLLLLERQGKGKNLRPNLRLLDPAACGGADGTCPTTAIPVEMPDITDADYEGLTQIADDLFLMVSDDQIKKEQRTVFVLMRVTGL
ncbi:MAG: esterase-like activity of phytase family protein [Paracoccus sp. (in: a-proteobacteria)]|uniref:esterase-like activity of phytase family protein n=1 Tax=Paracoccus sp. TaxID=267 RepID=UPI0026E0C275|nr:esterase-like activity of phytase family protein [Paracoccus sp. (in: a-proteobacteria)]MDO5612028.1 esterase-like activity of phytase family protein [Paracoccus sp. (in: a-proteobacteria)]